MLIVDDFLAKGKALNGLAGALNATVLRKKPMRTDFEYVLDASWREVTQGTHRISGDTAEVILRNRNYAQADYKRLETQQYFYSALVRTFLEEYDLPDYYTACKNVAYYINTDLDIKEIWGLYATMTTINPANIFIIRLPGGGYDYTLPNSGIRQSGYALDRDAVATLLNTYFRDPDMPVEAEKLNIPTDVEWLYGVTADPGKTLGDVNSGGDAA